ncbi:MAG: hemolysin family protein [Elainellaceae cyanobacterium]
MLSQPRLFLMVPLDPVLSATGSSSLLTGSEVLLRLLSVFLLIAINAFFVTAEFAIVSVRRSRINQLASAGDVQAKTVQDLQRGIERLLSTTQLGITLSSLALGWIGESTMAHPIAFWLTQWSLPQSISQGFAHTIATPVAFFLIAYLQIVLGELCPKSLALIYPEQLARFLGTPSLAIARIFNPFIWILNQSTRWLLRLFGVHSRQENLYNRVTPEELQLIISTTTESPGLEEEERELLTNVFEFGDVTAGEVMIPRTSIVAIPADATFETLLREVSLSGHSRYPIMGESLDDISGIIHFKGIAEPLVNGVLMLDSPIQPWVRPARFVPEHMPLSELLHLMRRNAQPMVMVVDEFGGTAGLVTIQDLAAEIIGDAYEIESSEELDVQMLDDQTFLVQAQMDIEEVNELLNLDLPLTEEYQTLGGFMIDQLQKIPVPGERLAYDHYEMILVSAEGPRLHQIQIQRLDSRPNEYDLDDSHSYDEFSSDGSRYMSSEDLGLPPSTEDRHYASPESQLPSDSHQSGEDGDLDESYSDDDRSSLSGNASGNNIDITNHSGTPNQPP